MSDHLNYEEIHLIVKKSPDSLSTRRYQHFMNCTKCQQELKRQNASDTILKEIKPKPAPSNIITNVLAQLSGLEPIKIKEKIDWIFLISIILLFTIGAWFVFSGKAVHYFQEYTSQVVPEKQEIKNLEFIKSIKENLPAININFDLPEINWGNIYLAMGIIVIIFYILLDRKISRHYKVHKT